MAVKDSSCRLRCHRSSSDSAPYRPRTSPYLLRQSIATLRISLQTTCLQLSHPRTPHLTRATRWLPQHHNNMPNPPRPAPAASTTPPSATARSSTTLPSSRSAPRSTPKAIDYAAELRGPWYRTARSSYLAVGVAVIAATGSLFGAQLKTTWQEYEAGKTQALAVAGDGGSESQSAPAGTKAADGGAKGLASASAAAKQAATNDEEISLSDLNRSISTLETVRGQLVQRRIQEELRLGKLRERVVERREVEARRTQVAGPSR